jgi:hypothetical protein
MFPAYMGNAYNNLIVGIIVFAVGNILWRVVCEGVILFFSIHETLIRLDQKTHSN